MSSFEIVYGSFTSPLSQTPKAMAINAKLVQARENPSAVIPIIGPTKFETAANTKPRAKRPINAFA